MGDFMSHEWAGIAFQIIVSIGGMAVFFYNFGKQNEKDQEKISNKLREYVNDREAIIVKTSEKNIDDFKEYVEHKHKNFQAGLMTHIEETSEHKKTVFKRMDERHKEILEAFKAIREECSKSFVRFDMHNMAIENLDTKTTEKFRTTVEKYELQLQNLTKAVDSYAAKVKEK